MLAVNKLKYLMLLAGVSAKELSIKTKIERSTLIKILNGSTTNPRLETIYSLAEYFKVDVKELVAANNENSSNAEPKEIKDVLASLMAINGIPTISLLTKYTGVATSMLSEILNGNTQTPQMNTLQQLATFFNVSIPQLTGLDHLPKNKTVTVTPTKKVLPVILLEQAGDWLNGSLKNTEEYYNISKDVIGNKAYALNINDIRFFPDFNTNQTLVIDDEENFTSHDFAVCKVNNHISIYECLSVNDNTIKLREAGTGIPHTQKLDNIEMLGVIVQQVVNRKFS